MAGKVLITGAGGYLGQRLAQRYLEAGDRELILWARARGGDADAAQRAALEAKYRPWAGRVRLAFGDIAQAEPFAGIDPAAIGAIVHGAAVIRFNVEEDVARRVNLEGTGKLLAFADRCPRLERLGLISSVYSSGLRTGPIPEEPVSREAGFCNHYEWSKWESEALLTGRHAQLPWSIMRVATVIADDEAGGVTQYNAVHNTLMLFYYGLLSLIPGDAAVPLYFVTGDFAAAAVFAAMADHRGERRVYHVSHGRSESATLGAFVDAAFDEFGKDEAFKARRLLKPLYADARAFDLLVEGMKSFGGGVVNESLASVTPFARQLFIPKDIANGNLRAAFPGYRAPDPEGLIRALCRHLVATRWGRASAAAGGA